MIEIKNWAQFQHYKDRTPPWIKLYRTLLDDRQYRQLSDLAARFLIDLWLLAAESKAGIIELDIEDIAWRLRDASKTLEHYKAAIIEIENQGLIKVDSDMLASCKQDAIPEERRGEESRDKEETETYKHKDKNKKNNLDYSSWPDMPNEQTLQDWFAARKKKKADVTQTVINQYGKELHKAHQMGFSVDHCIAECVTRNWQGFKAEWLENMRGSINGPHQGQSTSRSKRFSDELDEIARRDIEQNGFTDKLG